MRLTTPRPLSHLTLGALALASAWGCAEIATQSDAEQNAQDKVIGGVAEDGEPSALRLIWNNDTLCTATLIAPRTALTAAHCVYYDGRYTVPNSAQVVISGQVSSSSVVSGYSIHPEWRGTNEGLEDGFDVALLYLANDLQAPIVPIDPMFASERVGQLGKIVGFGMTEGTDPNSYGQKHSVELEVIGLTGTADRLIQLRSATSEYRASCRGDSGGPLFFGEGVSRVVAGVTSFGTGDDINPCQGDSYYVSAAAHADFIRQNLTSRTTGVEVVEQLPNTSGPTGGAEGGSGGGAEGWGGEMGGGEATMGWRSCESLVDCLIACPDDACAQVCWGESTGTAQTQFDELSACSDASGCAWAPSCMSERCYVPLQVCYPDYAEVYSDPEPTSGALSCEQVVACFNGCAPTDQMCVDGCFYEGSNIAQAEVTALYTCVNESGCADGDQDCYYAACQREWDTCF